MRCLPTVVSEAGWQTAASSCDITCCVGASIGDADVRYPAGLMRIDAHTLARLRRDLMRRGATLATLLSEVLAGKDPPQIAALLAQKPGLRPEEVLRLALDQIERRRRLIDDDDDRYGRCDACGVDLGEPALAEMPWADRCVAHAAF